ncbi:MAG: glutamate--cysteine ligase [Gammaproteobacteria bacterium]|nr:glutamate--cysteine ligase [Gammaproteobacteria bacterium]
MTLPGRPRFLVEERLRRLDLAGGAALLAGGMKGLEKESLRVTPDGSIATSDHPRALGSALTHPHITTDYSEALPELITPPFVDVRDTLNFMHDLHKFVYDNLDDGEMLWAASMPCAVSDDAAIRIAEYGSSNIGRMKHVYRVGLDYRYGRRMQAIAGVHFNYSLPQEFWPVYQDEEEDAGQLREFIDESCFALVRNFKRLAWLVLYLFGHSPAVCKSFLAGRTTRFKPLDPSTFHLPYATSLRMSDIGYKNKNQASLEISYDDVDEYVESLVRAIETPYPEYEAIGIKDNGNYIQLNTNTLQIENEYYSLVRPKRTTHPGEKPTVALCRRGVEYIEVRALDLNFDTPIGVGEQQLRFLEAMLIYCMLEHSPSIDPEEQRGINYNELTVALRGREPGLELITRHGNRSLREWTAEILDTMAPICEYLDAGEQGQPYQAALSAQRAALDDQNRLASARMLRQIGESGLPFAKLAFQRSTEFQEYFDGESLRMKTAAEFQAMARQSLDEQAKLEANDSGSFEEYLEDYFKVSY